MPKHDPIAQAAPVRLLRLPEVCALVGLSRSPVLRRVAEGLFPRPVSLGARAVAWRSTDVAAWIESRPVASGGGLNGAHAERAPSPDVPPVAVAQAAGRHARERRER